ncbi:Cytochrome c oxidase subunit 6, partial [Coelomomyces lativittatus]
RTYAAKKGVVNDTDLSYDEFTKKYTAFFEQAEDLFEVQRGLNNCFSHDLVPSTEICEAALKACRRVSDYPTAVRILQGLKQKCPSKVHYQQYMEALAPLCTELGIEPQETLGIQANA